MTPLAIPNHLLASHRHLLSREPDGVRLLAIAMFPQHITADSSSHLGNGAAKHAYSLRGERPSPFECLKTSARCRQASPCCG